MTAPDVVQVKRLRTIADLRARLDALGIADQIGADDDVDPHGPLAQPWIFTDGVVGERTVANRFTVLPMEGWDGEASGAPSELVRRRWRRFGESGAKLVWGGEAVAVRPDGRANPRQLVIDESTVDALGALRRELVDAHGDPDGLVVGLQLTHSGRWCRPRGPLEPRVAHHHPVLDERAPAGSLVVLTDTDLDELVAAFTRAAVLASRAGFDFVDIKHCHGYLLHELLGARDRDGPYGGSFEGRTEFLRRVVARIRDATPALAIGVRLSAYDFVPFRSGDDGVGVPTTGAAAAFGCDATGVGVDLAESHRFCTLLGELGIGLLCVTAGSPYYDPHIQRPAFFPPSDGYRPPNDPLIDAARMIAAAAELARAHPSLAIVGSGYSYLQQWIPNVAQHVVRTGGSTSIGIGRGMLSYPWLPGDVLAGRPLQTGLLCRTFSDCTTAPRNGLVSGCYPLDDFYKDAPARLELAAVKKATRHRVR